MESKTILKAAEGEHEGPPQRETLILILFVLCSITHCATIFMLAYVSNWDLEVTQFCQMTLMNLNVIDLWLF